MNGYTPPHYDITVTFKRNGVPAYGESEERSVRFRVEQEKTKQQYYDEAKTEVVEQQIIDSTALTDWEPFRVVIDAPSPPEE